MNFVNKATLLINCPDQKGIVASVSTFLSKQSGNILYLDQYVDTQADMFFMRVEWDMSDAKINEEQLKDLFKQEVADRYQMNWRLYFNTKIPQMAIFVSKMSHCLYELLAKVESGEWKVNIPLIISNHPDLKFIADKFHIPFYHIPITKETKVAQEAKQIQLLKENHVDFIVLARYMQILSDEFIQSYPNNIINIHHSFLPAFVGAKPYHNAYKRGVKIIGATSHYVTADLDAGPIIEQDVVRVTHKHTVDELVRKGRDLEKLVLSRAIWQHINRKVFVFKNKTIIFD